MFLLLGLILFVCFDLSASASSRDGQRGGGVGGGEGGVCLPSC